jgi:hypothetical protein
MVNFRNLEFKMSKISNFEPKSVEQYQIWLIQQNSQFDYNLAKRRYEYLTVEIKEWILKSEFWIQYIDMLEILNKENLSIKGFPLLMSKEVNLLHKSWESFYLKSFRRNILENKNFPKAPNSGWHYPNTDDFNLNDVFRCMVIVKYLDGVKFLESKQKEYFNKQKINYNTAFEARDYGYYACHSYLNIAYPNNKINYKIEIQITTQLQENIKQLTHKFYDSRRREKIDKSEKWQWNHNSPEFDANYLGHILHYLEAVILRLREEEKR